MPSKTDPVLSLPLHHIYSVDLDSQISSFTKQAFPYLPVRPAHTLTAVWIGINDVSDSATNSTIASFPNSYSQIIATLFESINSLYQLGYRDYLILNLPPLEHIPGNIVAANENKTLSPSLQRVTQWNHELAEASDSFARRSTGTRVMLFDAHTFLNKVWEDPAPYGIFDTTGYCAHYNAPDIATNYAAYGCLPIPHYFWYSEFLL